MGKESDYLKHIPKIIQAAASSPLGIFALMILVLSGLAIFFFKNASEQIRVLIFFAMFGGAGLFGYSIIKMGLLKNETSSKPRKKELKEEEKPEGKESLKAENPLTLPPKYIEYLKGYCAYMDVDKLRERGEVLQVRLPEIYIPLYAHDPLEKRETKEAIEGLGLRQREDPQDIEELAAKYNFLLIEGHPGSGKTTLLKHLSYSIVENKCVDKLKGLLPVLIPLRELKPLWEGKKKEKKYKWEDLLSSYLESLQGFIKVEDILNFCSDKKAMFLLDGLDEIEQPFRDNIVNALSVFMITNTGNKAILSGRPHGLEGAVIERFGKYHVKILELVSGQIEEFIKKWFEHIYSAGAGIGAKTADAMIGEIKEHEAVDKLIVNPFMLTAVCILYHDGKELPGQRAELYKRFVDGLLYKRFKEDSEKVKGMLMNLAYRMQEKGLKSADRIFIVETLKPLFKIKKSETEEEHRERIEKWFDDAEPKCGLLKKEKGGYEFWHLTFQEFLAAVYMVKKFQDYNKAVEPCWENEDYKEVIEMFISYLSFENEEWANSIVLNAMNDSRESEAVHKKWVLASKGFMDIQKDKRRDDTFEDVTKHLLIVMESQDMPALKADAGEILGRLGDTRDLKEFIKVKEGRYELEGIGEAVIGDFEMGKYPVVNQWFEEFCSAEGYKNMDFWSPEGKKWLEYAKADHPAYRDRREWRCPNSLVVGVSWYEADAFCKWLTAVDKDGWRYFLPDEKQWQAAAAGESKREYPWNGGWDKTKCNNNELKLEKTTPVGIFLNGNTPEGIADMAGNVWEWTISDYYSKEIMEDFRFDEEMQKLWDKGDWDNLIKKMGEKKRQLPALRGGSWFRGAFFCRCANRNRNLPNDRFYYVGFRCARTLNL